MPITGDVTAPRAQCVLLPGFPSSLAGVCLQPSHGLALRYRHGASAAGNAEQHPSLSCCDQRQCCYLCTGNAHGARTNSGRRLSPPHCRSPGFTPRLPKLAALPASQPHAWTLVARAEGPGGGSTFPRPPCPAQHPASLRRPPMYTPGCPGTAALSAQDSSASHPVISGGCLPLAAKLNIMWQHCCDRATTGRETPRAGVLHPL